MGATKVTDTDNAAGTLLHDTPERVPTFGQWVCSCPPCAIAVRASALHGCRYVLKGERDRQVIGAAALADLIERDELDAYATRAGLGYVREVFVAEVTG
jgi:hypothetical protein